jgi:hypothetical protein
MFTMFTRGSFTEMVSAGAFPSLDSWTRESWLWKTQHHMVSEPMLPLEPCPVPQGTATSWHCS